jgi:cytochrome c-type biogenesis protein CcmH/NrfG
MVKKEISNNDNITRQTLVGSVILALCVGFIIGAVFMSFKLSSKTASVQQQASSGAQSNNQKEEASAELASRILQLEKFLEKTPNDAQAWSQLGNIFFDSDQYEDAINAYEKSLSYEPDKINVITDLGIMYRKSNQPRKAIEMFDKAISLDNSFEPARFNKGIVLLHDLNDVPGGIKVWEELVKVSPLALAPNGESVDAMVQRMKKQQP